MVKVIFMTKEIISSRCALEYLYNNKDRIEISGAVIHDDDLGLKKICEEKHIALLSEEDIKELYSRKELEVDYILSFSYWKKIKRDILVIPKKGCINFHPGPLPEARGSGYHAAILENWGYFGVTAHYMDEEFDTGDIIECRHFSIDDNIVNTDLVKITHEQLFPLFKDIVDRIISGESLKREKQTEGRYFSKHELEENKLILQNESTEHIDRKIRAFWHPPYSGAQIEICGKRYTVINEEILAWIVRNLK